MEVRVEEITKSYSIPYGIKVNWPSYLSLIIINIIFAVILFCYPMEPLIFLSLLKIQVFSLCVFMISYEVTKVDIFQDRLIYKTLLMKEKEVPFSEIKEIKFDSKLRISEISGKSHIVDTKTFSQYDLGVLLDMLSKNTSDISISEKHSNLSKVNVKSALTSHMLNSVLKLGILLYIAVLIVVISQNI